MRRTISSTLTGVRSLLAGRLQDVDHHARLGTWGSRGLGLGLGAGGVVGRLGHHQAGVPRHDRPRVRELARTGRRSVAAVMALGARGHGSMVAPTVHVRQAIGHDFGTRVPMSVAQRAGLARAHRSRQICLKRFWVVGGLFPPAPHDRSALCWHTEHLLAPGHATGFPQWGSMHRAAVQLT
jgi:hypothetical protein